MRRGVSLRRLARSAGRRTEFARFRRKRIARIRLRRAGCPASPTQGDRHATSQESCPAAKKSAASAKAAVQATVTLKHLAAALSDSHDLPKRQAEAVLGDLVTLTARQNPPDRSRHPPGAEACCQDGTQPGDRRSHQDQGEQEDRIPAGKGTEGGRLRSESFIDFPTMPPTTVPLDSGNLP